MVGTRRAGLVTAIALIATAAACGRSRTGTNSMDDGLRSDLAEAGASGLELAPKGGRQVVVSPIEGGPEAAPATAPRRIQRPLQQPRRQSAVLHRSPAPQPLPTRRQVAADAPAPRANPAPQSQQRQPGVYSSEAEIFRQMPWIRP